MESNSVMVASATRIPSNLQVCMMSSHHYSILLLSNQSSEAKAIMWILHNCNTLSYQYPISSILPNKHITAAQSMTSLYQFHQQHFLTLPPNNRSYIASTTSYFIPPLLPSAGRSSDWWTESYSPTDRSSASAWDHPDIMIILLLH